MRHATRILLGLIFLAFAFSIFFEGPRLSSLHMNDVVHFERIPLIHELPSFSRPKVPQNANSQQQGKEYAENTIDKAEDVNSEQISDITEDYNPHKEGYDNENIHDTDAASTHGELTEKDLRLSKCFPEKLSKTDYTMQEILDEAQYSGLRDYNYGKTTANDSMVEVIIVPQSHNDPGWLMPLEDYYRQKTVHILNNMVTYLTKYTTMTMIWPEVIFLEKWWNEASEESRQKLRNLVHSGRLEIVSGGWVSPDEATCHYQAVLDQLIEGHQWLKQTLGIQPVNTWPLDQFGYSTSLPYIWQKADMKNLGILRVTQNVKNKMAEEKILDFEWRQAWDESGDNDVMCHVEAYTWFTTISSCGPNDFVCRELLFHVKNERMTLPMLSTLSERLTQQFKMKASLYKHKVIIVPLGGDFAYDTVEEWRAQYNNVTALMNYVNERKNQFGVTMRFGTVKDFFDRIKLLQKDQKYKTISGDFFTYAESHRQYWSGYFSTRPFDKRIGRVLMEHLKSAEILTAFSLATKSSTDKDEKVLSLLKELEYARRTLALFQHHDAITGTSTHATAADYRKRLHIALVSSQRIMSFHLRKIIRAKENVEVEVIPLADQDSYLDQMKRKVITLDDVSKTVLLWNSLERHRTEVVCLLVNATESGISVADSEGNEVQFQVNPILLGHNDLSSAVKELCFVVTVPAMGGAFYKLNKIEGRLPTSNMARIWTSWQTESNSMWKKLNISQKMVFKNGYLTVHFDLNDGLEKICLLKSNSNQSCTKMTVDWSFYTAAADAYVFVPNGMSMPMKYLQRHLYVISGNLLSRIVISTQLFQQVFTLYQSDDLQGRTLHVENNVSLVSDSDNGKELLMDVKTDLKTNNVFYTDANGLQMVRRTWRTGLPVGANFYPMTTMCFVEDHTRRLTVHSAQPLGVGSLYGGALNILIDRKPTLSGKGLSEAVLDNRPTTSKFLIHLEEFTEEPLPDNTTSSLFSSLDGAIINENLQNPLISFILNTSSTSVYQNIYFFDNELPCEVSVANFRNFLDGGTWNKSGITLHRRPLPCRIISPESKCLLNKNTFNLYDLFATKPQHIYKSSLTYFFDIERVDNTDNISLKNMDLESYAIKWR